MAILPIIIVRRPCSLCLDHFLFFSLFYFFLSFNSTQLIWYKYNKNLEYKIYLFIIREPTPATARSARNNAKKGEKERREWKDKRIKNDQGTEGETPYLNPSNWCAHRRRTEGKKEREQRKKQGADIQISYTGNLQSPTTTRMDHMVSLFLLPREKYIYLFIIRKSNTPLPGRRAPTPKKKKN